MPRARAGDPMLATVYLSTDGGLSRTIATTAHESLFPPVPGPLLDVEMREHLAPDELLKVTFVNSEDGTEVTLLCRVEWTAPLGTLFTLARLRVLGSELDDVPGILIPCDRTEH